MNIKKELSSNRSLLLLVSGANYNDTILATVKQLSKSSICYVTLNKTHNALREAFKKNKINTKNIIFIDAISKTIKKAPTIEEGCYLVSSPAAMTEMSIAISKFLDRGFEYLIFDSLNSLLVYQKTAPVTRYIYSLVNKIKASKTKVIFYALNSKEQEELIKETSMFVDKVIDTEKDKKIGKKK